MQKFAVTTLLLVANIGQARLLQSSNESAMPGRCPDGTMDCFNTDKKKGNVDVLCKDGTTNCFKPDALTPEIDDDGIIWVDEDERVDALCSDGTSGCLSPSGDDFNAIDIDELEPLCAPGDLKCQNSNNRQDEDFNWVAEEERGGTLCIPGGDPDCRPPNDGDSDIDNDINWIDPEDRDFVLCAPGDTSCRPPDIPDGSGIITCKAGEVGCGGLPDNIDEDILDVVFCDDDPNCKKFELCSAGEPGCSKPDNDDNSDNNENTINTWIVNILDMDGESSEGEISDGEKREEEYNFLDSLLSIFAKDDALSGLSSTTTVATVAAITATFFSF